MGGKWQVKFGETVETSIYEVDADFILFYHDGYWYPALQHQSKRGHTRECQLLEWGWGDRARVCRNVWRYRAEAVALRFSRKLHTRARQGNVHASPQITLLPVQYVLHLKVLRGSKHDQHLLDTLQKS